MTVSLMTALTALAAVVGIVFGGAALLLAESAFVSWSLRRARSRHQDSHTRAGGIQR